MGESEESCFGNFVTDRHNHDQDDPSAQCDARVVTQISSFSYAPYWFYRILLLE